MNRVTVRFCLAEPSQPFICGAWGHVTADSIEEMEKELIEDCFDDAPDGADYAELECVFRPDDGEGPSYWDVVDKRYYRSLYPADLPRM